jgi:hypothetical protein
MFDTPPDGSELPVQIHDSETIVRAVMTPWHVKKGKAKWQAFKPASGEGLSVIRLVMGAAFCKQKAVEIAASNTNNEYYGLLTILAKDIRGCGSLIIDSRNPPNYIGHADIQHGLPDLLPDEPAMTADEQDGLKLRCEALIAVSLLHHDPEPAKANWTGGKLEMQSA